MVRKHLSPPHHASPKACIARCVMPLVTRWQRAKLRASPLLHPVLNFETVLCRFILKSLYSLDAPRSTLERPQVRPKTVGQVSIPASLGCVAYRSGVRHVS
jgi:hypothetical protein